MPQTNAILLLIAILLFFFSFNCNKNEGNSETRILLSSSTNSLLIQLWVLKLWCGKAQDHLPRIRCNCPLKEQLWELPHPVLIKYYWRSLLWNDNLKNRHLNVNSETQRSKEKNTERLLNVNELLNPCLYGCCREVFAMAYPSVSLLFSLFIKS